MAGTYEVKSKELSCIEGLAIHATTGTVYLQVHVNLYCVLLAILYIPYSDS